MQLQKIAEWSFRASWVLIAAIIGWQWFATYQMAEAQGYLRNSGWVDILRFHAIGTAVASAIAVVALATDGRLMATALIAGALGVFVFSAVAFYMLLALAGGALAALLTLPLVAYAVGCFLFGRRAWRGASEG